MHRNIKGFDGIRALAVIAVVLTHLGFFARLAAHGLLPAPLLPMVHGGTGVQAFFVLSGFLITTLLIDEHRSTGSISIKHFMLRRTLRIFPLYILFLIAATLLHVFGTNVTRWESLRYAYLYAYNFVPRELYTSFIGHTWSLAVEEHFYLVWPAVFLLFVGKHRAVLFGLVAGFVVGAPVLHLLLVKAGLGADYFVERWSFIAGAGIGMGCLAALLVGSPRTADLARHVGAHPACLASGALLYANSLYLGSDSWFIYNVGAGWLRTLGITLAITWIGFNQRSGLVRLLEIRPLKYIGLISYGIYIYQGLFLDTGPGRDPSRSWPPDQTTGLVLLLLAAPLSYHFFERPFLRLKHRFARRHVDIISPAA